MAIRLLAGDSQPDRVVAAVEPELVFPVSPGELVHFRDHDGGLAGLGVGAAVAEALVAAGQPPGDDARFRFAQLDLAAEL
jgi:hypothetical protein